MVKSVCALLFAALCALPHDFHASITQIAVNEGTGRLEVAVKIFTDDLEAVIQPEGTEPLRLASPREDGRSRTLIGAYVTKNLRIRVDGVPVVFTFLGSENETDATWCYLESGPLGAFTTLDVTNTVLVSRYDDQVNIIHLKRAGKTKALMTNGGQHTVTFQ
ncbi:MAG: hypothetical protein K9J06_09925 [Flavobacteriales bacterium]|nr:hypothetical protein [Flavobacteriales bacterium]